MKQIAIIGMGGSEAHCPLGDPAWELWALPWHPYAYQSRRLFEMHPLEIVLENKAQRGGEKYWDKLCDLADCEIPIYMQKTHEGIESSVQYPLEAVVETLGRDYFGSSPAYPIALAIHEYVCRPEPTVLGLWGVDLKEDIWDHCRPNLEWLLGFAEAEGIDVQVHSDSHLFRRKHEDHIGDIPVVYPTRYGWLQ